MKWRWVIGWHLIDLIAKPIFRIKVFGRKYLKGMKACLIASNHVSHLDPPMIGYAAKKELFYIAKIELFQLSKFFAWLIKEFNACPVRRNATDISLIKLIGEILKKGHPVVIFPEGTRSKIGDFLPFKAGVGMLAIKYNVPVIPTYIHGTSIPLKEYLKRKARMFVSFGEPVYPYNFKRNKESYIKFTEIINERVKSLRDFYRKKLLEVSRNG